VRSITDLAPSAFLASSHLVWPLVSFILSPITKDCFNTMFASAERRWVSIGDVTSPHPNCKQSSEHGMILFVLACLATLSVSWLGTLPTASLILRLSDSEVCIVVGLRLRVPIVERHMHLWNVSAPYCSSRLVVQKRTWQTVPPSCRQRDALSVVSAFLLSLIQPVQLRGWKKRIHTHSLVSWLTNFVGFHLP